MLDTDTKRRIDTCRDILVGKVPDPKSQVEQITIALIYKFMDDMDLEAEELGGERRFFTKDYERYRWAKLVAPGVSGQDMLNTYSEALTNMVQNEGLPKLFRDIFRNAYLPYRDPETLRAFLREINSFTYDHSEKLGDAFEYLLSVLGSQGDAGQFRTPRHIIDFMVEIINPQKNEVIMDPACGTAGFLISAYKHILKQNSTAVVNDNGASTEGDAAEQALESPMRYPGDMLQPDDRVRLARNICGYDISPDMVRLSLVNLYLHGFADPKVEEYDTLTSEDKWTETADVILANPPFMSPKGGIKPHTRFQVQSKRSEVLFVDYIAEHLTPSGRAAIVVPEGIIFQSQTAYVALRKMLVENHLAAVISLPAGVFNPYSGVKTSILILDRAVAKASGHVAFFKIENDGFALGAQRKAVRGSQLAQVKAELGAWLQAARAGGGEGLESSLGGAVERARLAEGGDYNLSGERYGAKVEMSSVFPLVPFEEVCTLEYGKSLPQAARIDGPYPVMGSNGVSGFHGEYLVEGPGIVVGRKGSAGEVTWVNESFFPIDTTYFVRLVNQEIADLRYVYHVLRTLNLPELRGGAGIPGLNRTDVYQKHRIPLPPLEVQREIVTEIEGYQRVIDGARAVVDNYRPHIPVAPEWPIVPMGDVCTSITDGDHQPPPKADEGIPFVTISNLDEAEGVKFEKTFFVPREYFDALKETRRPIEGDLLYSVTGSYGVVVPVPGSREFCFQRHIALLRPSAEVLSAYLLHFLRSPLGRKQGDEAATGVAQKTVSLKALREFQVPLPPMDQQQAIVAEIEAEQALVNGNRDLIARFERKIDAAIARVWGEAKAEVAA
ncbi:N-6 DNA methylase [Rhizobium binae]|uniref:N-6 DNA methylase n=1 Tax=Rhizobium binae TaxID=1138190 RepID=UPI001C83E09D|nr:N-6 DNA methylase [Rhizobium binae]MBX4939020.1 N-6 DNA methylase [Rhizobium binae]MBX4945605.1 N-6 DNA methylase [Rhizobium binae]MBX4981039.1 N-6 DNA methylase [Rhizobium binae]